MTTTDDFAWPPPEVLLMVLDLDDLPEGSAQRLIESAVSCECYIVAPFLEDGTWQLDLVGRLHDFDCPHSYEAGEQDTGTDDPAHEHPEERTSDDDQA